jgi:flagellar motor switch protein FliG
MLREEMEYLGPVRLSNVEQTQQQIVDVVRTLEDAGELTVHGDDKDEQFIA